MGIQNLLKLLEPIQKPRSISDYIDLRVAIDGYSWLHKVCVAVFL